MFLCCLYVSTLHEGFGSNFVQYYPRRILPYLFFEIRKVLDGRKKLFSKMRVTHMSMKSVESLKNS